MRTLTQRLSTLLAATAGLALVAGASAANAADPFTDFLTYLTTAPTPAPQPVNPQAALYPNYNPNANLGQGSGNSGSIGR